MPRRLLVVILGGGLVLAIGALLAGSRLAEKLRTSKQPAVAPGGPTAAPSPVPAPTPATSREPKPAAPRTSRPAEVTASPTAEPSPLTGTLIIESDVPDTSVFVDRVYLGTAPVTARNLTPGPHRLNMSVTGYEGVFETIEVAAGTHTYSAKFKEVKLDEKILVIHKHGIGNCSGTLRASPQGLVYETTDKDDAFAVALTALETFQMDYLQKNLRVKIQKGKSYNFTLPGGGSVDALYGFHQNVEKARQRLLSGRRP